MTAGPESVNTVVLLRAAGAESSGTGGAFTGSFPFAEMAEK